MREEPKPESLTTEEWILVVIALIAVLLIAAKLSRTLHKNDSAVLSVALVTT